jgi:hypothetical protein
VYLVDNTSEGRVYSYDLTNPTFLGILEKIPEEDKHLISKTNGCLANARVKYRSDIKEVMAALREGRPVPPAPAGAITAAAAAAAVVAATPKIETQTKA